MQKRTTYWLIGCAALILLASGCFQPAGSSPSGISVANNTGATFTPFPSDTPPPTLTPETFVVTATTDFSAQAVAQAPTFDTSSLFGASPTPFIEQPSNITGQEVDPLDMTATYVIGQATVNAAVQLTATACALGLCAPTATDTPLFVPTAAPIPGADCIHEVRAEDHDLYQISLRYGVTVDAIVAATTPQILNPNLITIGEKLTIPGCGTTGAVPPPTSTATFTAGGGVVSTPIPSTGGSGAVAGNHYIVKQGDTLFAISMQTGIPVLSIASANGISNIDLIYINQDLVIPTS